MAAKIKKGDVVEVIAGRTSDESKLAERNKRREEQGLAPLKPGDKGKRGRVLEVFRDKQRVLVEGVNIRTHHVRQGQNQQGQVTGGIEYREAPIHISNVALVDPKEKKPTRVGFREEQVERGGRMKTVRVRYAKRSGEDI